MNVMLAVGRSLLIQRCLVTCYIELPVIRIAACKQELKWAKDKTCQ